MDLSFDVFVGVDMAKTDHYAHAIGAVDGVALFDRPVVNDEAAINRLLDDAQQIGRVAVVVDQSSSTASLLLSIAAARGVPVAYVTGLQMRRAAELHAGQAKTDPRDAWVLADFGRRFRDRLVWLSVTDELLGKLRILNGRDVDLAADTTRTINRCRDALVAVSPALERVLGSQLVKGGVRDLLAAYPTPTALRAAGPEAVHGVIVGRSKRSAAVIADRVAAALDAQSIVLPGESTWGEIIVALIGELDRLVEARSALAKQIEETFLAHPLAAVLTSLCGFGPRTGSRTLAEIGDPTRFANGARLAAYAGLAPVDRRSGRSINSAHASRRGNHRLKNALFIAAFVAAQHDPDAKAYYDRKIKEGKRHNAAIICLARKRCDLLWAMITRNEKYDPNREKPAQAA